MKYVKLLLLSSLLFSCGHSRVKYEPHPYVVDTSFCDLVTDKSPETGKPDRISGFSPKANEFTCFKKIDFKTLIAILQYARIPRKYKKDLEDAINDIEKKANRTKRRLKQ